jgi:hypothetical protein
MAFQKQGLQWCIEKEYPKLPSTDAGSPVQFWQFKRDGTRVSGLHVLCDKVSHGSTLLRRLTTLIVSTGRLFYSSLLTPCQLSQRLLNQVLQRWVEVDYLLMVSKMDLLAFISCLMMIL